jgi:myosin heavy subunit
MKKSLLLVVCAAMLVSCEQMFKGSKVSEEDARLDSLHSLLDQKDTELNEMMDAFNEIQEGFDAINEAEGRVNLLSENAEGNDAKANIAENMEFIETTLLENRRKIEDLQQKLKSSSVNASKLQAAINKLTEQLEQKTKELDDLRQQIAERDIKIVELGESVEQLKTENTQVKAESEMNAEIAKNQDAQLNTAWYMFGTTKELKQHRILVDGDVLKSKDFDADYFTKIDIRKVNVIPLNSKSAKLLTTHPEGSYSLLKDSKGEYTLRITNAPEFWSVSKYLVIRVK